MQTKMSSQDNDGQCPDTSKEDSSKEPESSEVKKRHKHKRHKDKAKQELLMPLDECRRMYKNEIRMLWREVEEFRKSCREQIEKQKLIFRAHQRKPEEMTKDSSFKEPVPDIPQDFSQELKKLEKNMSLLERNQGLLDQERELVEKEELLVKRQEKLKDYEKEVEEAEAMLYRRQSLCDKRTKEVENLNDDLLHLKHDINDTVDALESDTAEPSQNSWNGSSDAVVNSPEASAKARRHWTIARRHLIDKVSLLDATVQRYRTQLATATASITAKDLMIARLNKEISDFQEELRSRKYRINQLESQLSITTEEKMRSEKNFDMLMEELQNIDLNSTHKLHRSPEATPKHNGTLKQKLARKQHSTFSFFSGEGDKSVPTNERGISAGNLKDNFKRKVLNVQNPVNTTPDRRGLYNNVESNGDVRHELSDDAVKEEGVDESECDAGSNKRVLNGHRHRASSSSDSGSKACSVM